MAQIRKLKTVTPAPASEGGVALGMLERVDGATRASVSVGGRTLLARTTVPLEASQVGSYVTLRLASNEQEPHVILGVVLPEDAQLPVTGARLDRKKIQLHAKEELVLRCGPASLTLTKDGKVVLRGAEVVQTATGTHRIRGAAVHIN